MEYDFLLKLWGKSKTRADDVVTRYPLLHHMLDVAAVAREMWDRTLQRGARRDIAHQLGLAEDDAGALLSFWAALHDIGKATPVFQSQCTAEGRDFVTGELGLPCDPYVNNCHHSIAGSYACSLLLSDEALAPVLPEPFARAVAMSVGGHHGSFTNEKPGPRQRGTGPWEDLQKELYTRLADTLGVVKLAPSSSTTNHAFFIIVAGLTSVADWIASNEMYFPCATECGSAEDHFLASRAKAKSALVDIALAAWSPPPSVRPFSEMFPFIERPRPLQEAVMEMADAQGDEQAMVVIEAPMGEGKTEAAMHLAACWASRQQQNGCYFALPTQATSNQMFTRVGEFLKKTYSDQRINLQLVHGGALLAGLDELHGFDGLPDGAAEWFLPRKRGLLSSHAVGTIDQALLGALQTRHYFVRLFGLAHKTIVIDEVHAYDTYTSTLLEVLINWLHAIGSSVVLLSATLPPAKKTRLLAAYGTAQDPTPEPAYPAITWASETSTLVRQVQATQTSTLRLRRLEDSEETLCEEVSGVLGDNEGCIAVVCNTVARAQRAYTALKSSGAAAGCELLLIHARFPFEERDLREERLLAMFGTGSGRPRRAVVVATQVIEQSLDIDFDLMVTDFAPVDLMLQRAGRVHRHERHIRPAALATPALWLRMPPLDTTGVPAFGVTEYVYDRYILLRSYAELAGRTELSLPDDIPALVRRVYAEPEPKPPEGPLEEEMGKAFKEMSNEMSQQQFKAKANLVLHSTEPDVLTALCHFNQELEEDKPAIYSSLQALTRLAPPSVRVVCLYRRDGHAFLDEKGQESVDLSAVPTRETAKHLLRRSLSISDKRVLFHLAAQEPPAAWKQSSALRQHRVLLLEDRQATTGKWAIRLDSELGLLITDAGTGKVS